MKISKFMNILLYGFEVIVGVAFIYVGIEQAMNDNLTAGIILGVIGLAFLGYLIRIWFVGFRNDNENNWETVTAHLTGRVDYSETYQVRAKLGSGSNGKNFYEDYQIEYQVNGVTYTRFIRKDEALTAVDDQIKIKYLKKNPREFKVVYDE